MAMGVIVNLLTATELDVYSAHLSAAETTTWSTRWKDCILYVSSSLTWLEDYIEDNLEPAGGILTSGTTVTYRILLALKTAVTHILPVEQGTEFVVNKDSPSIAVAPVESPVLTAPIMQITAEKSTLDPHDLHPSEVL
ncbi:unnamed protein product [Allacma fusca]|uniref:Uncharacterized protein n=1 Tax=Allacma fusca TaxID=39272 RepID=A0A8J2KNB3_9HEXA|nr:unnamed protein product [Allacma fusca]